jgi:hypothetical protein
MKVRGFYDGSIQGLKTLMESDDNTLLEARNVASLQDGKTLENSIWFMPLDMLIKVLQQFYLQREQVKGVIYEITGISDIMRGETQASETFGAQNLKSQWGTLRLKRLQKRVQVYVRDCLRIMAELAGKHFQLETFAQMTDLDFALPADVQKAQQTMQQVQQMMMQMQQQQQMQAQLASLTAPPGPPTAQPVPQGQQPQGPPQPPPLPPQIQQAAQQAQAVLAKPQWQPIIDLLRNDLLRNYRIDIETNSTIDPNTSEDKQNMNEAIAALSGMQQQFLPSVQAGAMPLPVLKSMMLAVARRFQFGREVEDSIAQMPDQLPAPPPPPGTPTPEEVQATQAKAQADLVEAQGRLQSIPLEQQAAQQKMQLDQAAAMREHQLAESKAQLTMLQNQSKVRTINVQEQAAIKVAELKVLEAQLAVKKAQMGIEADGVKNERDKIAQENDRVNSGALKEKVKRDGEVHKAESTAKIKKASAPEPAPAKDETAGAIKELLDHIKKPATRTVGSDGKVTFTRH